MRFMVCIALALSFALPASAQEREKWRRLATFEDSVIEMDVAAVVFTTGKGNIGRVRFRITYLKPQHMPGQSGVNYKRVIETIQYKCEDREYRIYELIWQDSKGKTINTERREESLEWKKISSTGLMANLYESACRLIAEKKRNP